MKYVNEKHPEINVIYSTPTCYLKSLNEANITWNTKTDDFFPYSSDPHAFWAGYFTSRPAFKRFERWASGHLQSVKHLQVNLDNFFIQPEFFVWKILFYCSKSSFKELLTHKSIFSISRYLPIWQVKSTINWETDWEKLWVFLNITVNWLILFEFFYLWINFLKIFSIEKKIKF